MDNKLSKRKNDKENGRAFNEVSSVKVNNNKDNKRSNNKDNGKSLDEVKDKVIVRSGELPIKVFENRKSVLTELFEDKHLSSVYHIFMSFFVGMCLNSFVRDYLYNGGMRLGYNLISKGFRNMHLMMIAWFLIFFLSVIPYYGIKYWAKLRTTIKEKSLRMYLWDRACLAIYIFHLFGMLYLGTIIVLKWDMGFVAGLSSILETLRLIMKVYSFGRVCVSRVLNQPEKYSKLHPSFSKYMYFSFAPTLLYRDNYPKLPGNIRWGRVVIYFFEFVASIALLSMMFESVYINQLQSYGSTHLSIKDILMFMMNSAPYGLLSMFTLNYIVLHVWLNAFAEMLRFSDRLFYKDWWTSTTYERYYRTWNTVVHDWLYTYIYKDFFEIVLPKRKLPGKLAVFFLSSFFHDYAISVAVGYFIPIFFVYFFICGNLVAYVKFPNTLIGNVFLFYSLGLGASMMLSIYTLEYYSRINCIKTNLTSFDFYVPKLIECYK